MSKPGEIPYTWPQIEKQIKEAILVQASLLEAYGPHEEGAVIAAYLGVDQEVARTSLVSDIREFDITRHQLYHLVRQAYDYAYQLDGCLERPGEAWCDVEALLLGFPQSDQQGEPSPLSTMHDFALKRVLETFFARFALFSDSSFNPTMRELALLANMTVPAVRNSLSKEGFKLDKQQYVDSLNREVTTFRLKGEGAKLWLSRRRGFIPQKTAPEAERIHERIAQVLSDDSLEFPAAVSRALELSGCKPDEVVGHSPAETQWLNDLLSGRAVKPDIALLKELALLLSSPEPKFVARGVEHILTLEAAAEGQG